MKDTDTLHNFSEENSFVFCCGICSCSCCGNCGTIYCVERNNIQTFFVECAHCGKSAGECETINGAISAWQTICDDKHKNYHLQKM